MHRSVLWARSLVVAAHLLCACVSNVNTVSVWSNSTVPATVGPAAMGPRLARGRFSVEGAFSRAVTAPVQHRTDGAGSAAHSILRGRVAYGVARRVEVGLSVDFVNTAWRDVVVTGMAPAARPDELLLAGSLQARIAIVERSRWGFHALAEIGLRQLSYNALVRGTSWWSGTPTWVTGDLRPATVSMFGGEMSDRPIRATGLGGVYGTCLLTTRLELAFGAAVGFEPRARYAFYERGENEMPDVVPVAYRLVAVAFSSLAYTLGPVTFIAQAAGGYTHVAPFGATFAVRLTP